MRLLWKRKILGLCVRYDYKALNCVDVVISKISHEVKSQCQEKYVKQDKQQRRHSVCARNKPSGEAQAK